MNYCAIINKLSNVWGGHNWCVKDNFLASNTCYVSNVALVISEEQRFSWRVLPCWKEYALCFGKYRIPQQNYCLQHQQEPRELGTLLFQV